MLKKIGLYLKFVKFSHTVFALPFALIGYFLAYKQAHPSWISFILILLAMVFARSAAMGFNRYADRYFDKLNARTANRELPSGKISEKQALIFVAVSASLFILVTYFMNKLVFYLSPVALAIILGYSYTKRFTNLTHLILGLGLSLAPIGAYLAVIPKFSLEPIMFSLIVLFWVAGFDIIYALQDYQFDKTHGLKSLPVALGKKNALDLSVFFHIVTAVLVIATGIIFDFHVLYWIGSAIFIGLLIYQHLLVKPDDLSKVGIAFGTVNGFASIIYATFVILDLFITLRF